MVYYSLSGYNSVMFLVGILSWWYSKGFVKIIHSIGSGLARSADFFSIGLLARTLFNPFRQISADATGRSLAEKIRAYFDKLLSRIIGAIVRFFMIIFGIITIILQTLFGFITLIFWLVTPILPAVGLILMTTGWTIQ